MCRLVRKALFRFVFSFVLGLGLSVSASETVYPECKLVYGYPELVGDICSYDKKHEDVVYRVLNDEYEAIWFDDGQIMIWSHFKKPRQYDPTLYIFNDDGLSLVPRSQARSISERE